MSNALWSPLSLDFHMLPEVVRLGSVMEENEGAQKQAPRNSFKSGGKDSMAALCKIRKTRPSQWILLCDCSTW